MIIMLKKFSIGTIIIFASFALYTSALANSMNSLSFNNDNSFYIRGEGGYGWAADYKAKKVISFPVSIVTPLGVQPTLSINNKKTRGFMSRISAGYNINQYFGVETGFSMYHPVYRSLTFESNLPLPQGSDTGAAKTSLYTFDLIGKVTTCYNNFYASIESGAAYVHAKNSALRTNFSNNLITFLKASSKDFIQPKVGADIGYILTSNVAVDISYACIFGKGSISSPNYLPNLKTTIVGLTYKL